MSFAAERRAIDLREVRRKICQKIKSSDRLFYYMDLNRKNQVSLNEFKYGLNLAGIHLDDRTMLMMFNEFDLDNDGRISWDEFIRLAQKKDTPAKSGTPRRTSRDASVETPERNLDAESVSNLFTWKDLKRALRDKPHLLEQERTKRQIDDVTKIFRNACKGRRLVFGSVVSCAQDLFVASDRDGDGKLNMKEFSMTMKRLGLGIKSTDIKKMFKILDVDGSGYIDFEEFSYAMKTKYHRKNRRRHSDIPSHIIDKKTELQSRGVMNWTAEAIESRQTRGHSVAAAVRRSLCSEDLDDSSESVSRLELENSLTDQCRSWRDDGKLGIDGVEAAFADVGIELDRIEMNEFMSSIAFDGKDPANTLVTPRAVVGAIFRRPTYDEERDADVSTLIRRVEELMNENERLRARLSACGELARKDPQINGPMKRTPGIPKSSRFRSRNVQRRNRDEVAEKKNWKKPLISKKKWSPNTGTHARGTPLGSVEAWTPKLNNTRATEIQKFIFRNRIKRN